MVLYRVIRLVWLRKFIKENKGCEMELIFIFLCPIFHPHRTHWLCCTVYLQTGALKTGLNIILGICKKGTEAII